MAPAPVNVTGLLRATMADSGLLWVDTGERTYAVWFAWTDRSAGPSAGPTAYVVNGPGEQFLPWLPDEVSLVLRNRATRGRVLRVRARRQVVSDSDPEWGAAVAALRERRLNARDTDAGATERRWRDTCTVTALRPFGEPLETPERPHTGLAATRVTSWRAAGG
ncbi:MAG: hypothetical protein ACOYBY_03865 [Dermatophilaceae bacterium]